VRPSADPGSATRKRGGARQLTLIGVVLALLTVATLRISAGAQETGPDESRFATGTIAGVRFRIPREYLFFGVTYAGQNWLDPSTLRGPRSPDAEIEYFDMLLNPGLKPMSAEERRVWADRGRVFTPGGETREVVVHVEQQTRRESTPAANAAAIRQIVQRRLAQATGVPYVQRGSPVPGLVRWSQRTPGARPGREEDLYHDAAYRVFITCAYASPQAPYPIEDCHQLMYLAGLPVYVRARYQVDFLPRWQEVERRLEDTVRSFVVEPAR
jgi:hypothetical protein